MPHIPQPHDLLETMMICLMIYAMLAISGLLVWLSVMQDRRLALAVPATLWTAAMWVVALFN